MSSSSRCPCTCAAHILYIRGSGFRACTFGRQRREFRKQVGRRRGRVKTWNKADVSSRRQAAIARALTQSTSLGPRLALHNFLPHPLLPQYHPSHHRSVRPTSPPGRARGSEAAVFVCDGWVVRRAETTGATPQQSVREQSTPGAEAPHYARPCNARRAGTNRRAATEPGPTVV
jgi:hypothetical protein